LDGEFVREGHGGAAEGGGVEKGWEGGNGRGVMDTVDVREGVMGEGGVVDCGGEGVRYCVADDVEL
jgi:hypothetical protein